MRIIDVNCSIGGRMASGKIADREELLRQMDDHRIDHAVCWHNVALSDPKEGNTLMKEAADRSNGRVGVSAVLDPVLGAENLPGSGSLAERIRAFGPESLHVFPDNDKTAFHPLFWEEILQAADELAMPLVVDCAYPKEFFLLFPEIVLRYPRVKFILVRYGLCRSRHIYPLLEKRDNVYFTAEHMLDHLQIEEICEHGWGRKLLFGTSFPKLPVTGALGLTLWAEITEKEREGILCRNWEEIRP